MARFSITLLLLLPLFLASQNLPTIEEKTKGFQLKKGLFDFYYDESLGRVWLQIDKTDSQFLYITSLPAGLGSNDIGLDRGMLGDSRIISFNRVGRKLLMVEPNLRYRAITADKNERRAVEQSFAQSTLWGFTIEAETNGKFLVDATDFLLRDALQIGNCLRRSDQGNYSLARDRSAIYMAQSKNFPNNTELEATVTFTNDGGAGNYVSSVTPSAEAVTLRLHHSFVQLPDSNFEPRAFDARSSFIDMSYMDYSTPVTENIEKRFIIRHRLQKKRSFRCKK